MHGKKILVVDDSPRVLDDVSRMLAEEGCEIHTIDEPQQVLEETKKFRPDVILLDVIMPSMNGYDVFEQLQEDASTVGIPVVLMTAKAITLKMPAYLLQELAGIVNKPFSKQQLVHGLRTAIAKKAKETDKA